MNGKMGISLMVLSSCFGSSFEVIWKYVQLEIQAADPFTMRHLGEPTIKEYLLISTKIFFSFDIYIFFLYESFPQVLKSQFVCFVFFLIIVFSS